jgi:AraC family transcriptional regulator
VSSVEPSANSRNQRSAGPAQTSSSILQNDNVLPAGSLVQSEQAWREPPQAVTLPDGSCGRIGLSRWRAHVKNGPHEVMSDVVDDGHVMSIALRQTKADLAIGGKQILSGHWRSGSIFLTGPKTSLWQGTFRTSYDHLRAHLPQSIMAECYETAFGRPPSSPLSLFETCFSEDAVLQNIARAMSNLRGYDHVMGPSFVDALGLALASRLVVLYHGGQRAPVTDRAGGLAKWRLDRVIEYIEAHLLRPISLAELSEVAGLSRMHFATQFRETTGYPPYAYILYRRILRAQHLLLDPAESIVDVALRLGFSSQAHFTEAFRRAVGETPARWRRSRISAATQ